MLRATPSYTNLSDPFLPIPASASNFSTQYAGLYFSRLSIQRPKAFKAAQSKWPDAQIVDRVLEVPPMEDAGQQHPTPVIIAGTVYVDMPLKPCILDVIAKETWVAAPPPRIKYTSEKDKVLIEDESGRLELVGKSIDEAFLVSGVIIAVLGYENGDNQFTVLDVCFPEYEIAQAMPTIEEDLYIAIVSGISIGPDSGLSLELQLLVDFITGEAGLESDQQKNASICRLIVAGNSVAKKSIVEATYAAGSMSKGATEIYTPTSLTTLDTLLSSLCTSLPVDLMPGPQDPTNYALPQAPLLSGLLPHTRGYSSFQAVTNPYACAVEGCRVLGTAGQNVEDVFRFVEGEGRLEIAERMVGWAHLAPTAPDTLACYPFQDTDPFIIETHPDVFFVGNQPEFQTKLSVGERGEKTRIVLVPSFAETKTIALVNLRTLECRKVVFK
ncbi:DNA polymerase delta subunit 2 [Podochytrium sp. JEL0797]|nr:DNA polymerase delta subunit 2 [Podochytrium sp. JEL0797]